MNHAWLRQVRVIRGGREVGISTYDLLVGDVLLVATGDILAADGLLFQGNEIRCSLCPFAVSHADHMQDVAAICLCRAAPSLWVRPVVSAKASGWPQTATAATGHPARIMRRHKDAYLYSAS